MAQFGNMQSFSTVDVITALPKSNMKQPACIYIGSLTVSTSDASITVRPVGNTVDVTFSGLKAGTILPVMVSGVTSAVNIPVSSILLYK